ncbi:hypothetical protein D9615_006822 [Tricholomella constricta]|uniref:Cutinase n=1 Tax=Tricholomella constricta TaxID=117010 RepID=A0A8H5H6W3_9AGAR|nr:hypothetical protein D9615_006822 [Tricholomella constricta]
MRSSFAVLLTLALSAFAAPTSDVSIQACSAVTVYFARGTNESGTIGTRVGPQFKAALQSALGGKSLEFIGIDYPATIWGFLAGGDAGGATTMANSVTSKASSCPSTKIVISGYSQGAQVAHLAAGKMSATVQNRVNAAVVFGDPYNGQPFAGVIAGRSKTFCHDGDFICTGGILVTDAHTNYDQDVGAAAAFVAPRV